MNMHTVISVVVPLENDGVIVRGFLEELTEVMRSAFRFYEIILVDDGSVDDTQKVVKSMLKEIQQVRFMRLSRSFGRDAALSAGIESAIGDYVVTIDPASDPVNVIPEMVERCRSNGGIVHGLAENPRERSGIRKIFGSSFRKYCNRRLGVDLRRGAEDFRVMSRQAVNALLPWP